MNTTDLGLAVWSYATALAANLACLLYLHFAGKGWGSGRAGGAMFLAMASSALWAGANIVFSYFDTARLFAVCLLLDALRYGCWYAFLGALLRPGTRAPGEGSGLMLPLAFVGAGAAIVLQAVGIAGYDGWTAISQATWFMALALVVIGLVMLEQLVRNSTQDSHWHVKPLVLALAGMFLFDLYLFSEALLFRNIDADAFAARGFAHAGVVPLVWLSASRTKNWLAKFRLSQKAAFHSASLLFVGAYLLFMAVAGYYVRSFGGSWGRAIAVVFVFAALLLLAALVVSRSMRASLRVRLGKHFTGYRYDYREEWLRFTRTLSIQHSRETMGQQVVRGLADLVESPAGSLWLKDEASANYRQFSRWNVPDSDARERADSPLCRFITESGWVINLEEYRSFPGRYAGLTLPEWIGEVPDAWLVVPLSGGNDLIGFVVLSSARTAIEVNWEVNDLLRTAGQQAASFLAQIRATEALLEVQKFDAFNRMSAFVVHDLKNIVTQLSLLLKNAERHSDNPEFQADMRMTVQHSVERMRQLMLQLREGATPPGTPVGVDLARIIERLARGKSVQGKAVDIDIAERLMTRGHEERIERVIGHLVQNALDAADAAKPGGRVWVRLARHGGQALVEVGDTGIGMDPQFVRDRLFKPFQTTKQAGMGIGAYESNQYVQELGGKMTVASTVGEGTRIVVQLPLFEAGSTTLRDNPQPEAA